VEEVGKRHVKDIIVACMYPAIKSIDRFFTSFSFAFFTSTRRMFGERQRCEASGGTGFATSLSVPPHGSVVAGDHKLVGLGALRHFYSCAPLFTL
jgi:hypothetical protein